MVRALTRAVRKFHRDETGDEGVNKILIIAMIVIPLVIVLIVFGEAIMEFFQEAWANLTDEDTQMNDPDFDGE